MTHHRNHIGYTTDSAFRDDLPAPKLEGKSAYEQWLLTESQAARIIDKFGGPAACARAIDYDPSQIFRWRYPEAPSKKRGTGGLVPAAALRKLRAKARALGVLLTAEDLEPRMYSGDKELVSIFD